MKILLANDTALERHVGCLAVSDGHARLIGEAGHEITERLFIGALDHHVGVTDDALVVSLGADDALLARIDSVDAVVVNGEGTIHHGRGRPLLALLALAQARGKPTLLVNAVFQETAGFDDTLKRLDDFTVRESRSLEHARSRGLTARRTPDAILAARFSVSPPRGSGEFVTDGHWQCQETRDILAAMQAETGARLLSLMEPDLVANWRETPSGLAGARMLITGRHHGAYLALLADVPFVALASNTFKLEGLTEDLGRPDLMAHSLDDVRAIRNRLLDEGLDSRALLRRLTGDEPISSFRLLGRGGLNRAEAEVARLEADLEAQGVAA